MAKDRQPTAEEIEAQKKWSEETLKSTRGRVLSSSSVQVKIGDAEMIDISGIQSLGNRVFYRSSVSQPQ